MVVDFCAHPGHSSVTGVCVKKSQTEAASRMGCRAVHDVCKFSQEPFGGLCSAA